MKISVVNNEKCMLCGSEDNVLRIDWEKDGLQPLALCSSCRSELKEKFEVPEQAEPEKKTKENGLPAMTQKIADEAATLTEDAFGEKYLQDAVDRVVFEYIHGYGQMELDGAALSMMVLMLENVPEQVVIEHLHGLLEKGLVYQVPGRHGWYGADYLFADDI